MKKSLLVSVAFAMAATSVSAQPFAKGTPFGASQVKSRPVLSVTPSTAVASKPLKLKVEKKNNYYLRPEGALFQGREKQTTYIWGPVYMCVPGAYDVKFSPVLGEDVQTSWHLSSWDWNDNQTFVDCGTSQSDTYSIDADGSMHVNITFDGGNSLPTLSWSTDSFTIGAENPYFDLNTDDNPNAFMKYYPQIYSGIDVVNRRLQPLNFFDVHGKEYFEGSMDNNYVYGSGKFTDNGKTYTMTGLYQYYDKPMAPLYVEDIFLMAISTGYAPIPEGKELRMQIHDVLEQNGTKIPGENILYELTATKADVVNAGGVDGDADSYNLYDLVFTKKNSDGKAEGFVLDQPFYVVIDGLDGDGVDCGFLGTEIPYYYNSDFDPTYGIWKNDAGQPEYFKLYDNVAAIMTFTSKFDYANPMYYGPNENYGIVRISDDGNTAETIADGNKYPGSMIKVNGDWFDEDGNAQYTITGQADWVKNIEVDVNTYAEYEVVLFKYTCDALPAGVDGRQCELTIHGHGTNSTYPIVLLQGNATFNGINDVKVDGKANGKTYNLAGQNVKADAKGIVIRDGKKYVVK